MRSIFKFSLFVQFFIFSVASYYEQYRVPHASADKWESYILGDREYLLQNLPVTWETADILCRGQHNGTLAVLDTKEKAEFMAEVLAESQLTVESSWVGARRSSAADPAGYQWAHGLELRRTALDVLLDDQDVRHYPSWLNRTHVPVPEGGADCVALERVYHDKPVFVDLPCSLERAFVCEREARPETSVSELRAVRCRGRLYRMYSGKLDWHQAAAYCALRKMALANIATMSCLKKLGMIMLKTRPSIENAWVGARGTSGHWRWLDTGDNLLEPHLDDVFNWPPMRNRTALKQNGCLQLDRHSSHPPLFLEARCERKMHFICYQNVPSSRSSTLPPSDDNYYYKLVREPLYWQHAYDNCLKMNGTLATLDNNEIFVQLLLVMSENAEEPVEHIWVSGRLSSGKDPLSDAVTYSWRVPSNNRLIPDRRSSDPANTGFFMPPWLDEEFSLDSPCLNMDRVAHLTGLVYGLPCDTPQPSVCMISIEKSLRATSTPSPQSTELFTTTRGMDQTLPPANFSDGNDSA